MSRYLLVAEADKIQDFVFRAAHLREVAGGSLLLTRFCEQVPKKLCEQLNIVDCKQIVSDGGSFKFEFGDKDDAKRFGAALAELYRMSADGSLTVIDEPIEVVNGSYQAASQATRGALRKAKRQRKYGTASVHTPYHALCVNCGIGLAKEHAKRLPDDDEGEQYLCEACLSKARERFDNAPKEFLEPFLKYCVDSSGKTKFDATQFGWPGYDYARRKKEDRRDATRDVALFGDNRGYVAYLLADGNGIGKLFDKCSADQETQLSDRFTDIMRRSLATPTRQIKDWRKVRNNQFLPSSKDDPDWDAEQDRRFIPVLPLILGGDDLFALIPARWALDFAAHFCRAFSQEVNRLFEEDLFKLLKSTQQFVMPTISATVVICKENYPFTLAHRVGEEGLKATKRFSKTLTDNEGNPVKQPQPSIGFELILGSSLAEHDESDKLRPTLRPYLVNAAPESRETPIDVLLDHRLVLKELPGKRQAQLRELYNDIPGDKSAWVERLKRLLQRINNSDLNKAVDELASQTAYGKNIRRNSDSKWAEGSGLADLIEIWDFAYKIDVNPQEYQRGGGA